MTVCNSGRVRHAAISDVVLMRFFFLYYIVFILVLFVSARGDVWNGKLLLSERRRIPEMTSSSWWGVLRSPFYCISHTLSQHSVWSAGLVTTIGLTVMSYISQCSICIYSPVYVYINRHSTVHSAVYYQTRCKPGQTCYGTVSYTTIANWYRF